MSEDASRDALLILPLPPMVHREALPDFRNQLENGVLGDDCEVIMDEIEMIGRGSVYDGDDYEERHDFLRIRVHYCPRPQIM